MYINININDIDIKQLRKDLIDYYGTAMYNASQIAIMNITKIEKSSAEELIKIAINNNFDLNNYIKSYNKRR